MNEVLVLGNGISRMGKDELVRSWPGEVWACNRAYLELPEKLSRLTGHTEVLVEALEYQAQHPSAKFEIWSGHVGRPVDGSKPFTCPPEFRKDSGTTLVAQALHEGRHVAVLGFDLGGYDIHSPNVVKTDKTEWVRRWRALAARYRLDRVRFIGHDHKPYILGGEDASLYAMDYTSGAPHIVDEDYFDAWEKWTGRDPRAVPRRTVMVKVRFPNGYETELREPIALVMCRRGECKRVEEVTPDAPAPMSGDSTGPVRPSTRKPRAPKPREE